MRSYCLIDLLLQNRSRDDTPIETSRIVELFLSRFYLVGFIIKWNSNERTFLKFRRFRSEKSGTNFTERDGKFSAIFATIAVETSLQQGRIRSRQGTRLFAIALQGRRLYHVPPRNSVHSGALYASISDIELSRNQATWLVTWSTRDGK